MGNYYNQELTPELALALRDSLSRGQLMSKLSAVKLVQPFVEKADAFFIGHWHGMLPMLFYEHGIITSATGIELDPFWVDFSNKLNHYWDWKSSLGNADIFTLPSAGVIVNTSCEHMSDAWLDAVAPGTLVCAQSTDYQHPTHINTVNSLGEFIEKWSNFSILDCDSSKYDVYSRFTLIAIKK